MLFIFRKLKFAIKSLLSKIDLLPTIYYYTGRNIISMHVCLSDLDLDLNIS